MTAIPDTIKHFLDKQHFVIVSTFDKRGSIHTSAKGIIDIDAKGKIFILDLYKARTYDNVRENPHITLTVIDEHRFDGYSIEGRARIIKEDSVSVKRQKLWHDKLAKRIAKRVIRHVKGEAPGHEEIPEAKFPLPKYIIEVSVNRIVDLAPQRRK